MFVNILRNSWVLWNKKFKSNCGRFFKINKRWSISNIRFFYSCREINSPAEFIYVFNKFDDDIKDWNLYVKYYIEQKVRKNLFERWVAESLGKIAGAEKTYDDMLQMLNDKIENKPKRTATDIRKDLVKKWGKGD